MSFFVHTQKPWPVTTESVSAADLATGNNNQFRVNEIALLTDLD